MTKCWKWRPSTRPSFQSLITLIDKLLGVEVNVNYINLVDTVEELNKSVNDLKTLGFNRVGSHEKIKGIYTSHASSNYHKLTNVQAQCVKALAGDLQVTCFTPVYFCLPSHQLSYWYW